MELNESSPPIRIARLLIQINERRPALRDKGRMVIVETAKTPTMASCCPSCGQAMRFVRAVPRLGGLPELQTFECVACGVMLTEAVEHGGGSDKV